MPTLLQRLQHTIGNSFGAQIVEQTIEKAIKDAKEKAAEPKSLFYDPVSMFMGQEWVNKLQTQMRPDDLRAMANNPIIGSIVGTRLNQVAAFCVPRTDDYQLGYEIKSVDLKAKGKTSKMTELSNWIYTMGIQGYGETLLENFCRKFMRDSLVLDQACAEIIYRRNKTPAYAVCVDSGKIKKTRASLDYATPPGNKEAWYVMLQDEAIVAEYLPEEMIFGVRNPNTDIRWAGYGTSELEILLRTITTIINTEKYNSGQLTQGGTAKGVMIVKGDVDKDQFEVFKREFREAIRNASSYWRPPVLRVGKDGEVDWQTLDRSNRDMEYAQLFDFLVKQACGVYQMDPQEINWSIGPAGATVHFEGSNSVQKQQLSKDRGLRPLMTFLANILNINLIQRIDPQYKIEFLGFEMDRQVDADVTNKEVTTFKTVNEARKERKLPDLGPAGDVVLSQYFAPQGSGGINGADQSGNTDLTDYGDGGGDYSYADEGDLAKSLRKEIGKVNQRTARREH